jgi:membrane associated rhomboid family serine protease
MSYILLALTILMSLMAFNQPIFFEKCLFRPYAIKHQQQYWRWVSGGFTHADYGHLIVNMLSFYFFAEYVQTYYDDLLPLPAGILFAFFYLLAIVMSSMFDYYRYQDQFAYSALGASGAVAAVIFSFILFNPFQSIYLYYVIKIPAWLFGVLYLFYEYKMAQKGRDNIGHNAHFFGAIFGFFFPIILKPQLALMFVQQFQDVLSFILK